MKLRADHSFQPNSEYNHGWDWPWPRVCLTDINSAPISTTSSRLSRQDQHSPHFFRCLEHLKSLTKLRSLFLGHTKISDEGIAYLNGLKSLEFLDLNKNEGIQKLKSALPKCKIAVP